MTYNSLAVFASMMSLAAAANAQDISSHFVNLDFDSGVTMTGAFGFNGFDNPNYDIAGWNNHLGISDAGVQGPEAWWGPYQDKGAWINPGGSAFNLSDYTIQAGDTFSLSFVAQWWQWTGGNGQWTATLFYDNPANVIGSFVSPDLNPHTQWTTYTSGPIAATAASVGGHLGLLMSSTGSGIAQMDEITVSVPEPTTISLAALAGLGMLLKRRQFIK